MISQVIESGDLTIAGAGESRLVKLANALRMQAHTGEILRSFRTMLSPWGDQGWREEASWPSEVGDDHTPYEFSVALGARPELRILVEPLGDPPSLESNREQALRVLDELARSYDVSFARLDSVKDLFLPSQPQGLFSIWVAISFIGGRGEVKIYLNPEAQGRERAPLLVEEAMVRLGFSRAWSTLSRTALRRGRELDELKYFSLDMSSRADARVKVYVRHLEATVDELERAAEAADNYRPGDIREFVEQVGCVGQSRLRGRPPATCLSFVGGKGERASAVTHHFPVNGGYAPNDAVIAARVSAFLDAHGLSSAEYRRTLDAVAERPLQDGVGLQSYASLRGEAQGIRLTLYYPPQLYCPGQIAVAPRPTPPANARAIVERFEANSLAEHPFMRRLRREVVDLSKLWKLMANAQIGIVSGFAERLSLVLAKVSDDRIRCILARQLNDELGNGDYQRAHSQLFAHLVEGLSPWKPKDVDEGTLAPGRQLQQELTRIYQSSDPMEGVGAAIVIEIFGRQVDQFFGDEFRRQKQVAPESLEWLHLHEDLEVEHSRESLELAELVPAPALSSVWRGAAEVARVSTQFFDAMYGVCFS